MALPMGDHNYRSLFSMRMMPENPMIQGCARQDPLRPQPVSQLRTPAHCASIKEATAISSLVGSAKAAGVAQNRMAATQHRPPGHTPRRTPPRAGIAATAVSIAVCFVAATLLYLRFNGPLHADDKAMRAVAPPSVQRRAERSKPFWNSPQSAESLAHAVLEASQLAAS